MHERFSDRARHAMALANHEAGRLNHNYLIPAHLMLGLIAEGACVATETLRLLDVDLNKVREDVHRRLQGMEQRDSPGARAQSKELKQVIAAALKEAREHEHRYVGTEHLIVALLSQADTIPAQVLSSQGLKVDDVRAKALDVLRSTDDATTDLTHSRHGEFE